MSELLKAADRNQARASEPDASVWVSANAGTGKTAVLVRRILRLLLAGFAPECILCLTYTKTAAAEMQNRLLDTLAGWATEEDETLQESLTRVLGRAPEPRDVITARRLFACTLEARGGLKIHTIHGFCERLLQRFPLEAGVAPNFTILEERDQARHLSDAFDEVLGQAAANRESRLGRALTTVVRLAGEDQFRNIIHAALEKRHALQQLQGLHGAGSDWPDLECAALKDLFGLDADGDASALQTSLGDVLPDDELADLVEAILAYGGTTGDDERFLKAAAKAKGTTGPARAAALRPIFFTGEGKPRSRVCSAAVKKAAPDLCAKLDEAQSRYAAIDRDIQALGCAQASTALLTLADAIQGAYTRAKQAEAALDYDDLIEKVLQLFNRSMAAAWVLYKIDGGIDHILVDEAQDTNPAQWQIVEKLAAEFFAGEGASARVRTLFAVGDEKQSIYSFQGADPAQFGTYGRRFAAQARQAAQHWHDVPLSLSFRSVAPVLQSVDQVFAKADAAKGLTWQAETVIQHHAYREGQAGLVELWEAEEEDKPNPTPPFEPWNEERATKRAVETLAERIARTIRRWLDEEEMLQSAARPVRPGDILILVQRRNPFVPAMIRWLKRLNIPVAGADRMVLTDQLAVQDLLSLADVLLMPEDDLALAVVLKSPLFGLDDDDLFALAHDRRGSLWRTLQDRAGQNLAGEEHFAEAATTLSEWLGFADFMPPYEFFAHVLGRDGQKIRKRFLTRLGPEAAEAIDEMLELALAYDREEAPSLQGFVYQLRAGDLEIKRDMEQERDEVRIMTVHGAKGLQAPIVFLPDTCRLPNHGRRSLFEIPRAHQPEDAPVHIVWPAGARGIDPLDDARQTAKDAELEEYHRLLYVAMTRARDRLYIGGWKPGREGNGSWYDLARAALRGLLSEAEDAEGRPVHRLTSPPDKVVPEAPRRPGEDEAQALPDWARGPVPQERGMQPLTPSGIEVEGTPGGAPSFESPPLGPKALSEDYRFTRGRLIHALLEHLPQIPVEAREAAAARFIAVRGADLPEGLRDDIVAESLAIAGHPDFSALFAPGSLAEVPVVARIGRGETARLLSGQIDRLVLSEEAVLILDYKTNRPPPLEPEAVAPAYISQLAAYRIALKDLYPNKEIRACLLWTDGARLMEIPEAQLAQAETKILQGSQS
ncbi:ATP-dependent helicase/nuclease subunit A [Methyloligella halotolerans]|uniref:DNA 3'-5' helicase n=1 Tax=Methyloligella halotolerans TaxID=1177755 RepID=A0A1E2S0D4_9HYPH|nr:double-strand break repair helicase AddA [Methyloligella halotolerans]ODA67779.1 ATP-dependent helicase/nuclease subunit A [Methyloligella halotolerans]